MSTLWTFGCSYTGEYHPIINTDGSPNNYTRYKEWRGGTLPEVWPHRLARMLNYECKNLGLGGAANSQILWEFTKVCDLIEENDIVVIGWTQLSRFIIPESQNNLARGFSPVHPMGLEHYEKSTSGFSKETLEMMIVDKSNPLWVTQIYEWENLIEELSKSKKFHVFFWSSDSKIIYEESESWRNKKRYLLPMAKNGVIDYVIKSGGKTVEKETKGKVIDYHLGDIGHQKQAELFYENIVNNLGLIKKII